MSERAAGFLVVLERDIDAEQASAVLAALRQVRGVVSVSAVPASIDVAIAESRANLRWAQRLQQLAREALQEDR